METFNINENFDLFTTHFNNYCTLKTPNFNINTTININKENLFDLENKSNADILNLNNQLDNINLGHFDNNIINIANKKKFINNKLNYSEIKPKIKSDKESVLSLQSKINSNSTINNNIALMQTDSSFLSLNEENILNSIFKIIIYIFIFFRYKNKKF